MWHGEEGSGIVRSSLTQNCPAGSIISNRKDELLYLQMEKIDPSSHRRVKFNQSVKSKLSVDLNNCEISA